MQYFKAAIKRAAQLREESYDKSREPDNTDEFGRRLVDFDTFYTKSIEQAARQAAEEYKLEKREAEFIACLLRNLWNDTLDWAE